MMRPWEMSDSRGGDDTLAELVARVFPGEMFRTRALAIRALSTAFDIALEALQDYAQPGAWTEITRNDVWDADEWSIDFPVQAHAKGGSVAAEALGRIAKARLYIKNNASFREW